MDEQEIQINGFTHIKYNHDILNEGEMIIRSKLFYDKMDSRRSIREFSPVGPTRQPGEDDSLMSRLREEVGSKF